jgi:excisionase family DNA binding protein
MRAEKVSAGRKSMEENLLKGGEVAEILHISLSFAYTLMRRGDIPTVRFGNAVRVRPEDLEKFIHERSLKNRKNFKLENPKLKG